MCQGGFPKDLSNNKLQDKSLESHIRKDVMKIKRKRQLNKGIVLALTLCIVLTPMVVHAAAKYYFYNHPPDC